MHKKIALSAIFATGFFVFTGFSSCGPPPLPPTTSGGGFLIETEFVPAVGPIIIEPNVTTHWDWNRDVAGFTAVGDASSFDSTTNEVGLDSRINGRVPSLWNVQWRAGGPPGCIGAVDFPGTLFQSNPQRITEVFCIQPPQFGPENIGSTGDFSFSPSPLFTDGSSGSTATISGSGFSSQYGMPLLRYYDSSGNLVNQANVTSVASDGTWMTAPIPDVSQLELGTYAGFIYNQNSSGGYTFIGTADVTVLDPPPSPPGEPCPTNPCMPQN